VMMQIRATEVLEFRKYWVLSL